MDHSPLLAVGGFLDPEHLIDTFGTIGLITIIFAESFVAFFLPGDSLLFMAGFFASQGRMNLAVVCVGVTIAAIAGNQLGYAFGRKVGPSLFERDSRIFRKKHLEKTRIYFEKQGPKTIVLARFIPIVRTFACIVAGVSHMNYRKFLLYNVIGGVLWGTGVTIAGWVVGKTLGEVVDIDKYLLPIIAIIILLSFIPVFVEVYKHRKEAKEVAGAVKDEIVEEIKD